MNRRFEGQGVCAPLFAAHEVPENPAGDSRFIAPGQGGSIKVAAAAGSKLRYFCAVHPWMQGKISVR